MVSFNEVFVNFKETIQNLGIFSIGSIIAIIIILILLMIVEKKLSKKVIVQKPKTNFYLEQVANIRSSKPKKELEKLDKIGKAFIRKRFKIRRGSEYAEIKESLLKHKQENKDIIKFCEKMSRVLYSGEKTQKDTVKELIFDLRSIIERHPIQENKRVKKKSFFARILIFVFRVKSKKENQEN